MALDSLISLQTLAAFAQVVLIDISLAADNAVVIGLAAAGLMPDQRRTAILWGVIAATVLRVGFALTAVQLLGFIGLAIAGGILLLWVCWKMWCDLHPEGLRALFRSWRERDPGTTPAGLVQAGGPDIPSFAPRQQTLTQAVVRIIVADVSMSLDNVLAVAGAAREHPLALGFGLVLSVTLMGGAAMTIARLLERHKWIAYLGLVIVLFVALRMIFDGSEELLHAWA